MKKKEYLMTENVGSICIHTTEMDSICDFWKNVEDMTEPFKLPKIALDAFNTANKCGLLPSELLEQNQKLLSALTRIKDTSCDKGRKNCSYGDTEFDSESAAFGYNLCLGFIKEIIRDTINQIEQ